MNALKELSEWLGILLVIAAAVRVVCIFLFPQSPAAAASLQAVIVLVFACGAVCLARLALWLQKRWKG